MVAGSGLSVFACICFQLHHVSPQTGKIGILSQCESSAKIPPDLHWFTSILFSDISLVGYGC